MLTLNFSEDEIQRLKYEKDLNPSTRLRKRCYVIYLRMNHNMSTQLISEIVCCHRNSVRNWISSYQSGGISSLLATHYYCPKSELEIHKEVLLDNLNDSPV